MRVLIGLNQIALNNFLPHTRKNLWDFEVKVFSQFGEDGILAYLFSRIGVVKPNILEVGAGNFAECNSRMSVQGFNANAYLVDGRSDLVQNVDKSDLRWRSSLFAEEIFVTPQNIVEIWKRAESALGSIDALSIDIDGIDYWVLNSLDLSAVSLMICEYNPLFGDTLEITVPDQPFFNRSEAHFSNLYYGMSLRAAIGIARRNDLTFVGTNRVGNNAFFVKSSLKQLIDLPLPDLKDLSRYCDWHVRESRDQMGNLTYLDFRDATDLISSCDVFDINDQKIVRFSSLI
jgi:hypothetical protein